IEAASLRLEAWRIIRLENHQCYIQPEKERNTAVSEDTDLLDTEAHDGDDVPQSGYSELLFFDFECRQENGNHEPNLCVVQNEAGDEWVFEGDNTKNEFCEWLFTKEHVNCIVLAHNFQGYDGYFIQQYLHENGVIPEVIPEVIPWCQDPNVKCSNVQD
ncbi:DNA polymerase, partial [Paramuricea clavata]